MFMRVRESLYEKFVQDSDPIADMGIGMINKIKEWIKSIGREFIEEDLLCICARHGKTEFVKYLLDAGVDVHEDGDRALRFASENGHTEIVKLLLDAGADVHADGDWALQLASYYGHVDVVKILKDHIAKEKKNKVVKESLNEKFVQDSDPIKDLGIGIFGPNNFNNKEEFYEFLNRNLAYILKKDEIPKVFVMANDTYTQGSMKTYYYDALKDYVNKYVTINGEKLNPRNLVGSLELAQNLKKGVRISAKEEIGNAKNILSEKFTEDSDPIEDMGIGIINKIFQVSKKFYSFEAELYSEKEWKKIINWMLEEDHKPWEILAILDNTIMRYASDESGMDKATLDDFQDYNAKRRTIRGEFEIDRILNNYKLFQPDYVDVYKAIVKRHGIFNEIQEQNISEKFIQNSDPIRDMGIGGVNGILQELGIKKENREKNIFYNVYEHIIYTCIDQDRDDLIKLLYEIKPNLNEKIQKNIYAILHKALHKHDKCLKALLENGIADNIKKEDYERNFDYMISNKHRRLFLKYIKESINEKFTEDSDPISDMNIGLPKIVYVCGNCGSLLDEDHNELSEENELELAKRGFNYYGASSDKVRFVLCARCDSEIAQEEYERYMYAQEKREREEREREEDEQWRRENLYY